MEHYINKYTFLEDLCNSCSNKQISMGFIKTRICMDTCLVVRILESQKVLKVSNKTKTQKRCRK